MMVVYTSDLTEEINKNSNILYYSNDSSKCIIETDLPVDYISFLTEDEVKHLILTEEWNINQ